MRLERARRYRIVRLELPARAVQVRLHAAAGHPVAEAVLLGAAGPPMGLQRSAPDLRHLPELHGLQLPRPALAFRDQIDQSDRGADGHRRRAQELGRVQGRADQFAIGLSVAHAAGRYAALRVLRPAPVHEALFTSGLDRADRHEALRVDLARAR